MWIGKMRVEKEIRGKHKVKGSWSEGERQEEL